MEEFTMKIRSCARPGANEITVTLSLAYLKSNVSTSKTLTAGVFSQNGSPVKYVQNVQNVGTSEEALVIGDITTLGWVWFKNLDATNPVSIRQGTGGTNMVKLMPGECACFRFGVNAPYVIATGSAVELEYLLLAD
jgi:hypothetical protein